MGKGNGFNIKEFGTKYKEVLLYLIFGGLTTVISIATFALFYYYWDFNEVIANVLSWVLAVLVAFSTNRSWVFSAPTEGASAFIKQMTAFFAGRLATLGIEEAIILVFITWLGFNAMIVKVIAQVVVIVLNYVISKFLVFRK